MTTEYLSPLCHSFQQQFPGVSIKYKNLMPHEAIQEVLSRKSDIALAASYRPDFSDIPDCLASVCLGERMLALAVAENNQLFQKEVVSIKDLEGQTVRWVHDDQFLSWLNHLLKQYKVTPSSIILDDTVEDNLYNLSRNNGVLFTSYEPNNKKTKRFNENLSAYAILCYHKDNHNPTLQLFYDAAQAYLNRPT